MRYAAQLLDQVQSLAGIAALEAEPRVYANGLAGELGDATTLADLAQRDDFLRHALGQVDAMIERVMRIRLDHALATDTSIPGPTRKVFATTIVGYVGRIELLEARARDVAARGGAADPELTTSKVVDAAYATLALRVAVRTDVLALVGELAAAAVPLADRSARDRQLDDPIRRKWSAARRELEAIVAQPDRIVASPIAARLTTWPEQLDEPDPVPEATFADLIEMD